MSTQPRALELADFLDGKPCALDCCEAADLLRSQHEAIGELWGALKDFHLNVSEAMATGGWIPTPLHQSFWHSMSETVGALSKHKEQT